MGGTSLAIAALAVGAVSTGASVYQGIQAGEASKKSARAQQESLEQQEKARREQTAMEQLKLERARRQALRQQRIAQADVVAGAEAMGATGSSAAIGAASSVQAQGMANAGFTQATGDLAASANTYLSNAATFQNQAIGLGAKASQLSAQSTLFGQIGNLAFGAAGDLGSGNSSIIKGTNNVFGSNIPQAK